jgi:aminoglycoside N3'-acetyltransferase
VLKLLGGGSTMANPITKARVYFNAGKHYIKKERYLSTSLKNEKPVDISELHEILDNYSEERVVFVHAGLSDIKSVFHKNPYKLLLSSLDDRFDSILTPGFTPTFRKSGIYHKLYSRPEYGAFSRLFLEDADYRTNDALHSILVKGDYSFDDYNHFNTFSREGCWAKLDDDNVLYMNIGVPWITATQHHYIEHYYNVPYNSSKEYNGWIYYDEFRKEPITQVSYQYETEIIRRNSIKIEDYLHSKGALERYTIDGLKLMFFRAREMRDTLEPKIEQDSYYLVD